MDCMHKWKETMNLESFGKNNKIMVKKTVISKYSTVLTNNSILIELFFLEHRSLMKKHPKKLTLTIFWMWWGNKDLTLHVCSIAKWEKVELQLEWYLHV